MRTITSLVLLGIFSAGHAQEAAAPYYATPYYVGVSVGSMHYDEDLTVIDPELASFKDSTTAWKLYGGYHFNEHFGIEGGYVRSDDSWGAVSGTTADDGDYSLSAKADFRGYSVKAMGYLPTSWGRLFAGIGHYENRSDLRFVANSDCCEPEILISSDGFSSHTAQIGAEWNLESVILRADYEWWDFYEGGGGAAIFGLGAKWQF